MSQITKPLTSYKYLLTLAAAQLIYQAQPTLHITINCLLTAYNQLLATDPPNAAHFTSHALYRTP